MKQETVFCAKITLMSNVIFLEKGNLQMKFSIFVCKLKRSTSASITTIQIYLLKMMSKIPLFLYNISNFSFIVEGKKTIK